VYNRTMKSSDAHGVIDQSQIARKNDYLFRISLKALVRNEQGEVLVVKEVGRTWWDLPGGGMDHGESIQQALARELREEVNLEGNFDYDIIAVEEPAFLPQPKVWQIRLIFEIKPVRFVFSPGDDGDEIRFIDSAELKNSDNNAERKVYAYAQRTSRH